jgi:hypothetical protein
MNWTTAANETLLLVEGYMGACQEDSSADSDFQAMNFRTELEAAI